VTPILDILDAALWTKTVNETLGCAMTPAQVAELPEETLWVLGAMLEQRSHG
jgi:hypothetical protein